VAERLHCSLHDSSKLVRWLKYENKKWEEFLEKTIRERHQSSYNLQTKIQKAEIELEKLCAERS
jgi:hypothetical protein